MGVGVGVGIRLRTMVDVNVWCNSKADMNLYLGICTHICMRLHILMIEYFGIISDVWKFSRARTLMLT